MRPKKHLINKLQNQLFSTHVHSTLLRLHPDPELGKVTAVIYMSYLL